MLGSSSTMITGFALGADMGDINPSLARKMRPVRLLRVVQNHPRMVARRILFFGEVLAAPKGNEPCREYRQRRCLEQCAKCRVTLAPRSSNQRPANAMRCVRRATPPPVPPVRRAC